MVMDEEECIEFRERIDRAAAILYALLDQEYGTFKKAPDDHPLLKALDEITPIGLFFATPDEDEDEEAA